ncbi:MAG: transporter substrate-binding domain-containing protein [Clostridiaceae bacterium]|nr:transporter substrate-binding domain-containing protein [Clostridiaceae bacterium]
MKSFKKIAALAMALMMFFALAACGSDDAKTDDTDKNEEEKETLTFGTSADYAPFEFHTMVNGVDTIAGFDVEIAKQVAADMGKELEIKDISFDVLLNELQNGTIDFVVAGMSADEERLKQADASDVYYDAAYQRVVVRKEDADKYKSFDDFAGVKVGVQSGTIQVDLATENLTGCETLILQGVPDLFNNLINGKCDAVLVDGNVGDGYIASNDTLTSVELEFPPVDGCVVWVQKGDPQGLLESINKTISKIKEDGSLDKWMKEADELSGQ